MTDSKNYDYKDMNPHVVVVDIETAGLGIDCVILSIGAVYGNVLDGTVVDRFYKRIQLDQPGRVTDSGTLKWWEQIGKETPKAYDEAFNTSLQRISLYDALSELNQWINTKYVDLKAANVVGNGPEFDNARLEHAMRQYGLRPAWYYGGNQSFRTVVWMGRLLLNIDPKYTLDFKGLPHIAIDDAEHEFLALAQIIGAFKARLSGD